MSTTTRIEVRRLEGRTTCTLRGGHFSARRIDAPDGRVRVALVATVALLLAGDDVRIEVVVGTDVDLEIVEIAGTVAYDMRGGSADWHVDVRVEDGGLLIWSGLPFIVADGADVSRSMTLSLDGTAQAVLRETYVFGRTDEAGGDLRTSTVAVHEGRPLLVEDLDLRRSSRSEPAIMGAARCFDAVTVLGRRIEAGPAGTLQLQEEGSVARRLLGSLHSSDLTGTVQDAIEAARRAGTPSPASDPQPQPEPVPRA
jgi:urease accessory protein